MKYVLVCVAALALACGGGSDDGQGEQARLLQLDGQSITADNYRSYLRTIALQFPAQFAGLCQSIRGLSVADANRAILAAQVGSTPNPFTNATPMPGQVARPADNEAATAVLLDECARIR
jgi:hypothetical protein